MLESLCPSLPKAVTKAFQIMHASWQASLALINAVSRLSPVIRPKVRTNLNIKSKAIYRGWDWFHQTYLTWWDQLYHGHCQVLLTWTRQDYKAPSFFSQQSLAGVSERDHCWESERCFFDSVKSNPVHWISQINFNIWDCWSGLV